MEQEARAEELAASIPEAAFYFGLVGVTLDDEAADLVGGFTILRRVTNPPGIIHVARAADPQRTDYLAVSRYSTSITSEIAVPVSLEEELDEEGAAHVAWHAVALLKLTGASTVLCPASASVSWDTVSAHRDNSVQFRTLDDVPRQFVAGTAGPQTISVDQTAWVRDHFMEALRLRGENVSRRFGLAFNLSYTWNHTSDLRVAIASVWSGLESLFGDQRDARVTQALACRISSWVPSTEASDVRRLYKQRCDAVHGRWLSEPALVTELRESAELLRESLVTCIERRLVPLPD